jgi:3-oxoacyl-[acyl-carrier-protein] synthase III
MMSSSAKPWTCWACLADKVPISVDHYGNTSAASTLILLDEDRRAGKVQDGDLIVFVRVGAGNGAMNGYAAMLLNRRRDRCADRARS